MNTQEQRRCANCWAPTDYGYSLCPACKQKLAGRPGPAALIVLGVAILYCLGVSAAMGQQPDLNVFGELPQEHFNVFAAAPATEPTVIPAGTFDVFGSEPAPALTIPLPLETGIDRRPVVMVYSLESPLLPLDRMTCIPCKALIVASRLPGFPYSLQWRTPPVWVTGYPTLHWQDASGGWHPQVGWTGLNNFLRRYRPDTLPGAPAVATERPATPATQAPRVQFSWRQIANSPGRRWGEGNRAQFPTTRQHLLQEHGIPLSETDGMTQGQLDRLHGYMHTGAALSTGPIPIAQTATIQIRVGQIVSLEKKNTGTGDSTGGRFAGTHSNEFGMSNERRGSICRCC